MGLYEQAKAQARKVIEQKVQEVPYGERIHIDARALEELLFDTIEYNRKTGDTFKLPVWSGSFLQKIDLSEVDFDDVAWSILGPEIYECGYEDDIDADVYKLISGIHRGSKYFLREGQLIDYSGTNAKIDLAKSWEAKKRKEIALAYCAFKGVDLSESDTTNLSSILECDISYTGIKIPVPTQEHPVTILESNLNGIDLSEHKLDIVSYLDGSEDCMFLGECSLKDTGLNISTDRVDMKSKPNNNSGVYTKQVYDELSKGLFDGCYINGVLIEHSMEPEFQTDKERKEYKEMLERLLSSALNNIEDHSKGKKK